MRKVFLFLTGFLLLSLAALLALVLLEVENHVKATFGGVALQHQRLHKKELTFLGKSEKWLSVQDEAVPIEGEGWQTVESDTFHLKAVNFLGLPLVVLQFPIVWKVHPEQQAIVLTQISRKGQVAQSPVFPWQIHLQLNKVSEGPITKGKFKVYQLDLYLYRRKLPLVHHFKGKLKINSRGELEVLQ